MCAPGGMLSSQEGFWCSISWLYLFYLHVLYVVLYAVFYSAQECQDLGHSDLLLETSLVLCALVSTLVGSLELWFIRELEK